MGKQLARSTALLNDSCWTSVAGVKKGTWGHSSFLKSRPGRMMTLKIRGNKEGKEGKQGLRDRQKMGFALHILFLLRDSGVQENRM
jgi:hypothetical protein